MQVLRREAGALRELVERVRVHGEAAGRAGIPP